MDPNETLKVLRDESEDAEVRIEMALSDPGVIPPPQPSEDLVISWEYFDGKKWRILGKTTPRGKAPAGWEQSALGFVFDPRYRDFPFAALTMAAVGTDRLEGTQRAAAR